MKNSPSLHDPGELRPGAPEKNLASTLSRTQRAPERLTLMERAENELPLSMQAEFLSLSRASL